MKKSATLKQFLSNWRGVLVATPTVAGFIIALRFVGLFQMLEWAALDQWFRLRLPDPQDSRIVIVGIDETTIRTVGQWPIPDGMLAKTIEKIRQQQPRAIGMDIYRDLPVEPGHQELIKVMASTPNLIGVQKVVGNQYGPEVNPAPVLSKLNQVAASDLLLDADGKVRRGLLSLEAEPGQEILSLGARLALMYLDAEGIQLEERDADKRHYQLGKATFKPFEQNDGGYIRADDKGYQVLLNFAGTEDHFPIVSMAEVLNGTLPKNWGRDRVVLIGATAASIHDSFFTPYSSSLTAFPERMPGVAIHAQLVNQILSAALDGRPHLQVWSDPVEWVWILLWSGVGAVVGWAIRSQKLFEQSISFTGSVLSLGLAGGTLGIISYIAFLHGWWVPLVPPLLALNGSATVMIAYIVCLERQDRETIMTLFRRHVTPQVAEVIWMSRRQLLQHGVIPGQEMTATVLFSDLEGFSTIATRLPPPILMLWLNEYMQAMTQIVLEYNGVVNKFIGDAVMALFGVPIEHTTPEEIARDAQNAVACALAMADKLRSLNRRWQLAGRPTVSIRIGIATGPLITGSLGSAQKLEYTALGDTVNIAARLESYDKSFNRGLCRILISEETYHYVKNQFPTQFVSRVQLKGRDEYSNVYQILIS